MIIITHKKRSLAHIKARHVDHYTHFVSSSLNSTVQHFHKNRHLLESHIIIISPKHGKEKNPEAWTVDIEVPHTRKNIHNA